MKGCLLFPWGLVAIGFWLFVGSLFLPADLWWAGFVWWIGLGLMTAPIWRWCYGKLWR